MLWQRVNVRRSAGVRPDMRLIAGREVKRLTTRYKSGIGLPGRRAPTHAEQIAA